MAPEQALAFAGQVEGLRWVKVGLELFVQAGPEVVAQLREQGLRVFLDLKFHDIPATMAGFCRRAAALGAELITVHACRQWRQRPLEGPGMVSMPPTLLAVTVLTSRSSGNSPFQHRRQPALAQLSAPPASLLTAWRPRRCGPSTLSRLPW